ncbi:hypothetical protein L1N85_10295 [Paenibacillus alkaliterrae]|uniref:hypothetical protein n=1 Tax=Paenibacillus alkaliterrae TaxID=320909 RepID=UPI001F2DB379|nr:hypothetical protein [Paenibacillus alkaliterrae]MCF2938825.1 hypothetical protein [Paenibacillus alkaliterrae]
MHLFRLKVNDAGMNRMPTFLEDNYVCFGLPGIGDLNQLSKTELRDKLAEANHLEEQELERGLEEHSVFAHAMQDGDYLIVDAGERIHLGDLGDYYYIDLFDNAEDNSGHRRGVTWLNSLQREDLHPELLAFLSEEGGIGKFGRPVTQEQVESMLSKPKATGPGLIDEAMIQEAIDILKTAMRSEDADRRERAAIAILQAARI